MAVVVNVSEVLKPTKQPSTKVTGTWRSAKKVYTKAAGAWSEGWPLLPNPPQTVHVNTSQVGEIIVIDGTWAAPAVGATAHTGYRVRAVFTDSVTKVVAATSWVDKTSVQVTHRFDNGGAGWAHRSGDKVKIEVYSFIAATAYMFERVSSTSTSEQDVTASLPPPVVVVPPVAAPAAPTSFVVSISECELTQTWAHPGGAALDYFEIQTWRGGPPVTTYKVGETLRKWTTYPWEASTIGRSSVSTQISAVGQGGRSAWVRVDGVMPGPVTMSDYGYKNGSFQCTITNAPDGVGVYSNKLTQGGVFQDNYAGRTTPATYTLTGSSGFARDGYTQYRMGFLPRNNANGWTGRPQWGAWCVKLPLPVYIAPVDCNTWWSIPIPGKWRTNPQAENWFYQGKSISGNSYGTLFYKDAVQNYFDKARIGYDVAITSWDIYVKRTNTGGLVAAVALNINMHNNWDDSVAAAPTIILGPVVGPALARDQKAWVALSTTWWPNMYSGYGKGISFYVDPAAADNQLRSEIGNVSNRYMILDKPTYGTLLDSQIPGTLRIYHDG